MRGVGLAVFLGALSCAAAATMACGVSVVGGAPVSTSPDGGDGGSSAVGSDGAAEGGGNAPVFCTTERADPTVKRCIDFDDAPSQVAPRFGFDAISNTTSQTITLVPSTPSSLGGGNALKIALGEEDGTRNANVNLEVAATQEAFVALKSVILDTNVVIDAMTVTYAALVAFQIVGEGCAAFSGVAAHNDGTLAWVSKPETTIGQYQIGVPFHLRVVAKPKASSTQDTEAFVNGASIGTIPVTYNDRCNYAGVFVGTFFSGVEPGTISTRFDNVVVRVP